MDYTNSADASKLGYVGSIPTQVSRDSSTWFTPNYILEKAREVLGTIDLDPFSCNHANQSVQAQRYLTVNDDALITPWCDSNDSISVWMNPPYSRGILPASIDRFLHYWNNGNITEGIILINNTTDTKYFKSISQHATAFCFTDKRLSFENIDGKRVSGNTRGQVFVYYGTKVDRFVNTFDDVGLILTKYQK